MSVGIFPASIVVSPAGTAVGTTRQIIAGTGLTGGGDLSVDRTVTLSTPISVANGGTGKSTAQGVAVIMASGSAIAQTAAVANVAMFTTGSSGGSFEIGGYIDVTAFTAGTISLQCDYTDPAGTARTLIIPLISLSGTIGITVGSATDAQAVVSSLQTSGANSIKIYTTVSIFTGTYNVYGWIKQVG